MKFRKTLLTALVLVSVAFIGYSVNASDDDWKDNELQPIRKLSRGLSNVAFGAFEVVMNMENVQDENGGIAAVTYGVLKGVSLCLVREVVGVVEVVTFLIPFPGATYDKHEEGWGYGPLIRPEWVVGEQDDWWNFVYPDYPPE